MHCTVHERGAHQKKKKKTRKHKRRTWDAQNTLSKRTQNHSKIIFFMLYLYWTPCFLR